MEFTGKVRVGRRKYRRGGYDDPHIEGYTPIICLTKSTAYGSLSPYELKDERGRILECLFQFSKVYKTVPESVQYRSRYDHTVIWDHPAEVHIDEDGELTDEYFAWREKGMNARDPIRYPVGYKHRHECLYALADDDFDNPLNYVGSRKHIYLPEYLRLVKPKRQFKQLLERLRGGENLLIIEVDGPHEESMDYYRENYTVEDGWITNNTIEVNEKNMKIMLEDEKHPFGHGYCLGIALLDELHEFDTRLLS